MQERKGVSMRRLLKVFLCVFCCYCCFFGVVTVSASDAAGDAVFTSEEGANRDDVPVSLGLRNLAAETDMVVSARVGELYYFSAEDFFRAMNLSEISYITIESVPSAADGTLFLGSSTVTAGQVISSGNIGRLTYSAASGETGVGRFTFSADGSGYSLECRVYAVSDLGSAPTTAYAPGATLAVSTHEGLSVGGMLSGYDEDGDALVYEIVSAPSHGSVRILDRAAGTYSYTPASGYAGEDSFRYVVRDAKGNYSTSREVMLTVKEATVPVSFVDLSDDSMINAALTMAENHIMDGVTVGGEVFFYPENTVSRVDFLVMAMRAVGYDAVSAKASTVFCDNEKIPESLRGYVSTAYDMGVVSGVFGSDGLYFEPNRAVTRAEAAKILSGLIECSSAVSESLKSPNSVTVSTVTFEDKGTIPAWAEESVYHLSALGIFIADNGNASVSSSLTRADAAEMFSALLRVME